MPKSPAIMNPVVGFTCAFSSVESIPMLNGSNYSEWKEHLLLVLGLMDLDISLREERPDASKHIDKTEHWDRSNRMSLMIMSFRIPPKFRGIVPEDVTTAKEYLTAVEKCYAKREMSDICIVLDEFLSKKKVNENVREYIMTKMSIAAKMKKLGMHIPDNVLVDMLLDSLPPEYDQLKKAYSFLQEKWSTHELIAHCVQEERRMELENKDRTVLCGNKRNKY